MKKLDFRNFSVPTGITRQTREVFDAREQIADLLYTRVSGIKAHRLAFKIFESTGETEFSDEETGMIHMAVERYCLPNVIDALNEILGGQKPIKTNEYGRNDTRRTGSGSAGPCTPEFYRRGGLGDRHLAERCEITARGEGRQDGERPPGTDREACERCRRPCRGCRQESGRSRSRTGGKTQAATEAATKANEAAAKAENAAAKVEQTTAAAIGRATARFPHGWKQATFYLTRVPNRAAA